MPHTESIESFTRELKNMTLVCDYEKSDHYSGEEYVLYLHNITGDLWIKADLWGMGGGCEYYYRYDDKQEIQEVIEKYK